MGTLQLETKYLWRPKPKGVWCIQEKVYVAGVHKTENKIIQNESNAGWQDIQSLTYFIEDFGLYLRRIWKPQDGFCECVCMSKRMCVYVVSLFWKHKLLKGCMSVHSYTTGFGWRVVCDHICTSTQSHWLEYGEEIEVGIRLHVGLNRKLMLWFRQRWWNIGLR